MPISLDFQAIVLPFEAAFQKQLASMTKAFLAIGKKLGQRLGKLRPADRETSDIPVVGFSGGAIRVSIDPFQHGALRIPSSSPESRAVRAGAHFVDSVAQIGRSARQEWILPGLIGTFANAIGAIVDSMRRFEVARPEMFDPRGTGRASDFLGIAGLFVRAFGTSARETTAQSRKLRRTLDAGAERRGTSLAHPEPTRPLSLLENLQSFERSLEQGTRWITGAILLLPLLGATILPIMRAAALRMKVEMLDRFQNIEQRLFAWRRGVIDWFDITLREMGRQAWDILEVSWLIISDLLRFAFDFGREYVNQLLTSVNGYLDRVSTVLRRWIETVRRFHAAIKAVLEFNLMPILIAGLLGPLGFAANFIPAIRSRIPKLTVDDLISMIIGVGLAGLRTSLRFLLTTVEGGIRAAVFTAPWPLNQTLRGILRRHNIYQRLDALRQIINLYFTPPRWVPPPPATFTVNPPPFPNLGDALFGSGTIQIGRVLTDLLGMARKGVVQFIDAGAELASGVARHADAGTREFLHLGSVDAITGVMEQSRDLGDGLFGPQARTLRERIDQRRDPFAQGFETVLATVGLDIVFSALPSYLASIRQYWARRQEMGESGEAGSSRRSTTPTSPHILARRTKLGCVCMGELRIEAPAGRLDEAFVKAIAARIRGAVSAAYQTGRSAHEAAA